jgi:hypothetical protein
VDGTVVGFMGSMRVSSKGGLTDKLSGTQRTLMDVWEVCLCVEGA